MRECVRACVFGVRANCFPRFYTTPEFSPFYIWLTNSISGVAFIVAHVKLHSLFLLRCCDLGDAHLPPLTLFDFFRIRSSSHLGSCRDVSHSLSTLLVATLFHVRKQRLTSERARYNGGCECHWCKCSLFAEDPSASMASEITSRCRHFPHRSMYLRP